MKIVKINGGLGNQMFQYAFARALEYRTGESVCIDISSYRKKTSYGGIDLYHNGFELAKLFDVPYREAPLNIVRRLSTQPDSVLKRFRRKYVTKKTHYIDKQFSYTPAVFDISGDCYFEGYWQTEKYFLPVRQAVIDAYKFVLPLSAQNTELLSSMPRPAVSIHVRRGDYLNSENLNVCTPEYFSGALEYIQSVADIRTVLVFSDDIGWCRENIRSIADTVFVDWNRGNDSWQDMAMMSACDCNVIANSSFSWWAAYLNQSRGKIVTAPKPWNMREVRSSDTYYRHNFADIIPESWKRIPI